MRTGLVETWVENPVDVGPMYPFVGSEVPLFVVCVVLWIAYTIWQIKHENATYAAELDQLAESESPASATDTENKNS